MRGLLKSIGPAIIVAAVVLGPGSILTSSKVGATFGVLGLPVVGYKAMGRCTPLRHPAWKRMATVPRLPHRSLANVC